MTINKHIIDDFLHKILANMPSDMLRAKNDLEKNIKSALQASFSNMDLVTREEFDIQSELLARTRTALQEQEKKLAELEKLIDDKK